MKSELDEITQSLKNLTEAIEKDIITETVINCAEELEQKRWEITENLSNMHQHTLLKYEDFLPIIEEFKSLERGTESFRTFIQYYVNKVTVYPYHIEIELNKGLGIADELNEIVTIKQGQLYQLFESRVRE